MTCDIKTERRRKFVLRHIDLRPCSHRLHYLQQIFKQNRRPVLPLFIILGMLMGSDGIFGIEFSDFHLAEQVCSVALIFIMFYGGFGTNWKIAKPVAVQSVLLSTLGVVVTSVLAGLFCHLVLKTSLLEGLLIGSVIGSPTPHRFSPSFVPKNSI